MSEAKHTPGPWSVKIRESSFRPGVFIEDGVCGPDGEQIRVHGFTLTNSETAKANARLIAAAPEMLEALRSIVSALGCKGHDGWHSEPVHESDVNAALAAISKALGEESQS